MREADMLPSQDTGAPSTLEALATAEPGGKVGIRVFLPNGRVFASHGPDMPEGEIGPISAEFDPDHGIDLVIVHNHPTGPRVYEVHVQKEDLPC